MVPSNIQMVHGYVSAVRCIRFDLVTAYRSVSYLSVKHGAMNINLRVYVPYIILVLGSLNIVGNTIMKYILSFCTDCFMHFSKLRLLQAALEIN